MNTLLEIRTVPIDSRTSIRLQIKLEIHYWSTELETLLQTATFIPLNLLAGRGGKSFWASIGQILPRIGHIHTRDHHGWAQNFILNFDFSKIISKQNILSENSSLDQFSIFKQDYVFLCENLSVLYPFLENYIFLFCSVLSTLRFINSWNYTIIKFFNQFLKFVSKFEIQAKIQTEKKFQMSQLDYISSPALPQ